MIFASLTQAYELTETVSIAFALLGLAVGGFTAIWYRARRNYNRDSIEDLTTNNDLLRQKVAELQTENIDLRGKLSHANEMVTAAPEIAKLGKQMAKEHKESMKLQKAIIDDLTKLVGGVGK